LCLLSNPTVKTEKLARKPVNQEEKAIMGMFGLFKGDAENSSA